MALDTLTPDEWQALDQAAMAHRLTPMGGQSPSPPIPDMGGLPTISPHVVAPLPATREADIAAGTKLQPGVGKELYAGGLPSVSAEPFTPKYYEQERERSDFQHLHPMGSEVSKRPGFLGKLEHGLATAGNIAGNIVAPGTMANIPGTEMNQRLQRMGQAKGYEQAVENEQRQAQTAGFEEANREVPFTPFGETEPIQVRAASLPTLEAAKQRAESVQGRAEHPENMDQELADAVTDAQRRGVDPMQDSKVKQLLAVRAAGQKPTADNATQEAERYEKIIADQRLGKTVSAEDSAWSKAYERNKQLGPFGTAIAQAPQKATERSDKSYQYATGSLDKVATPIEQINQRLGRLNDTLAQHSMQADALIAPELLSVMSGGAGSGLRMNEAEIARIVGGRTNWETLKASMQKWNLDPNEARSITPDQDRQIRALVGTVQQKIIAKSKVIDDARDALLDSDDPKEHRKIVADTRKKLDAIDAGIGGDTVRVQLPGHPEGSIPRAALDKFKKDHPDAKVLE